MRKNALLAMMLAMTLLLSSCALIVKDQAVDDATVIIKMGDQEIWAKPLEGGEIAVCFMNRGGSVWKLDYNWTNQTMYFAREVNLRKFTYTIRDLWQHKVIGTTKDRLKADIPAHGVLVVRLAKEA